MQTCRHARHTIPSRHTDIQAYRPYRHTSTIQYHTYHTYHTYRTYHTYTFTPCRLRTINVRITKEERPKKPDREAR
eukprot:930032-Heterocapsa_arctica.AAC.1